MTTNHLARYRVGAELARYVRSQTGQGVPPVTALQAVVADIAATTPNLAIPLRDLVSRQGFQVLLPLAGSGSGELQCKALVDDIRQLYHPDVVEALLEVLNGFLECSSGKTPKAEEPAGGSETPLPRPVKAGLRPKVVEEQNRKYTPPKGYLVLRGRALRAALGGGITLVFFAAALAVDPSPAKAFAIAIAGLLTTWALTL